MAAVASTRIARCAADAPSRVSSSERSRSLSGAVCSRRALGISLGIAFGLRLQQVATASARDVPLFGIRKRVEKVEKVIEEKVEEIVKEGKQVVKEGKEEAKAVLAAAAKSADVSSSPLASSPLAPGVQAGAVIAAELLGVAVASSIVNGLVATSK